jgi:hypothetical protein
MLFKLREPRGALAALFSPHARRATKAADWREI